MPSLHPTLWGACVLSFFICVFAWCAEEVHEILAVVIQTLQRPHWVDHLDFLLRWAEIICSGLELGGAQATLAGRSLVGGLAQAYIAVIKASVDVKDNLIALAERRFYEATADLSIYLIEAIAAVIFHNAAAFVSLCSAMFALLAILHHMLLQLHRLSTLYHHYLRMFVAGMLLFLAALRLLKNFYDLFRAAYALVFKPAPENLPAKPARYQPAEHNVNADGPVSS